MREYAKNVLRAIRKDLVPYCSTVLLVMLGVAVYTGSSMYTANMDRQMEEYFESGNFADVFAYVGRFPEREADRLYEIEGIEQVSGRLTAMARLLTDKTEDIVTLQLMAETQGTDELNLLLPEERVKLSRTGLLLGLPMEQIYQFEKGEEMTVLCNDTVLALQYEGDVVVPEELYYVPDTVIQAPVDRQYGVAAVQKEYLEEVTGMTGMWTELGFKLRKGYSYQDVEPALKSVLREYGLYSIVPRQQQHSYREIKDEIGQYKAMSIGLSVIFLLASAFMSYIIIRKMIDGDRTAIGTMKAMGASDGELIRIYLLQGLAVALPGAFLAMGCAYVVGKFLFEESKSYYCLRDLTMNIYPLPVISGILLAVFMILAAFLMGVGEILKVAPAESMRAAAPRAGRNVRFPKWLMIFAIGFSVSMIAVTNSMTTVVKRHSAGQFELIETYDIRLVLRENVRRQEALDAVNNVHILRKEAFGTYPMEMSAGERSGYYTLIGLEPDGELYRVHDNEFQPYSLPEDGLLMSRQLADKLGVEPGDVVDMYCAGNSAVRATIPVTKIVTENAGANVYLRLDLIEKYFQTDLGVNSVLCRVEKGYKQDVVEGLKNARNLEYLADAEALYESYKAKVSQIFILLRMVIIFAILTGVVIIYSIVSISVRERRMEFGTMIALGMRSGEVFEILGSEQLFCFLSGLLLSIPMSYGLARFLEYAANTDIIRVKLGVSLPYYAVAVGICAGTVFVSVLLANRSIGKLDLTDVLKERA